MSEHIFAKFRKFVNINDFRSSEGAYFQLLNIGALLAITGVREGRLGDQNLERMDAEDHEGSKRRGGY